jgi:hypothetical protein
MRKIIVALLVLTVGLPVFAQELILSGEGKSGIITHMIEDQIHDKVTTSTAGSTDDAGFNTETGKGDAGRFRLNMEYLNNNLGFKLRINWQDWSSDLVGPKWPYAFVYGNFFEDQLTVAIGKLGGSPWGSGGPELWKELEATGVTGGIRFEYKPSFAPGLNVGFVINGFNKETDEWPSDEAITFLHVLQESVIGASYTHDYFMLRAALKLDSKVDAIRGGGNEGMSMVYRVEERAIRKSLPGFSIWALGYYEGFGADNKTDYESRNWLFIEFAPAMFTTQLRFGTDIITGRTLFHVTPNFYWKLFNNLLNVGAQFRYTQDYGEFKTFEGSPYYRIEVEPKIQLNFAPNAYMAFAYNWARQYTAFTMDHEERHITEPIKQIQWFNLRFAIYY